MFHKSCFCISSSQILFVLQVANMLYLESPAGSGESSGFSTCISGGKAVSCEWDDVNQGEAYAHTLQAFFKAFPEYGNNDLYLTGESYFGQYGISEPMRRLL